jgi:hypothetical protein
MDHVERTAPEKFGLGDAQHAAGRIIHLDDQSPAVLANQADPGRQQGLLGPAHRAGCGAAGQDGHDNPLQRPPVDQMQLNPPAGVVQQTYVGSRDTGLHHGRPRPHHKRLILRGDERDIAATLAMGNHASSRAGDAGRDRNRQTVLIQSHEPGVRVSGQQVGDERRPSVVVPHLLDGHDPPFILAGWTDRSR